MLALRFVLLDLYKRNKRHILSRKEKAMAEFTNENQRQADFEDAVQRARLEEASLLEGFTTQEIASLVRVRQAVALGRFSETTQESKRLLFARWLAEHGRLDG
jgi:hypothetical protein